MISKGARQYLAKSIIAVEVGCLIGAYRVWHMMNISQDYRKSVHKKYPSVLEMFYYCAEKFAGNLEVRKNDYDSWGISKETE